MNAPRRPNRFELSSHDVELTYDTTSIAGQPQLGPVGGRVQSPG